jgi:hypothetical protein
LFGLAIWFLLSILVVTNFHVINNQINSIRMIKIVFQKKITFLICPTLFLFTINLSAQQAVSKQQEYVLMVQPIVLRGDDGTDPASMALPESLVDKAYEKSGVDFYFLEPIYYNNTKARDGLISLDEIVKQATKDNLLRGHGDMVNMFFVNAVDGRKGPLGRGMFGGNITFIALVKNDTSFDVQAKEAFVIAHEVGHNLSLQHAVDDPNVRKDVPNIMGDGPFEKRIDPQYSLIPYQIEILKKSPLIHPRTDFLSKEEGQKAILDETFEPYFSQLQKREVTAFTGQDVPFNDIEKVRGFAREKFVSSVLSFTQVEKEALDFVVAEVNKVLISNNLNRIADHPWRFIKVESWLCGGFAHTRGNFIILSDKRIKILAENFSSNLTSEQRMNLVSKIGALIVHEQMHCMERTHPSVFENLYTQQWNFKKADVEPVHSITINQVSNPDAPLANWLIKDSVNSNTYYWIRTSLREGIEIPEMGKDFITTVFKVQYKDGRYTVEKDGSGKLISFPLSEFKQYSNSFPASASSGLDHPNEITAYMMAEVFKSILRNQKPFENIQPEAKDRSAKFMDWYKNEMQ